MAEKKPKPIAVDAPVPGAGTAEGETLRAALHAFDAGDYRTVGRLTAELSEAEDAAVREAALALRTRIGVDPVQIVALLACVAILFTIVYTWVL